MPKVIVETALDGTGFQTGLQSMLGGAERFQREAGKKFSIANVGKDLVKGFLGLQLVDSLVAPLRDAADYAKKIADSTDRLREINLGALSARGGEARAGHLLDQEIAGNEQRLTEVRRQKAPDPTGSVLGGPNMPDFANSYGPNFWASLFAKIPVVGDMLPTVQKKAQFNDLSAEETALQEKQDQLRAQREALARQELASNRATVAAHQQNQDQQAQLTGQMGPVDAAQRELDRLLATAATIRQERGAGAEANGADLAAESQALVLLNLKNEERDQAGDKKLERARLRDASAVQDGGMTEIAAARAELARLQAHAAELRQRQAWSPAADAADLAVERQAVTLTGLTARRTEERRANTDARAGVEDQMSVRTGQLSEVEAERRELARLQARAAQLRLQQPDSAPADAADLAATQQRLRVFDAQNRAERGGDAPPTIAASSLAQLGGGGSVNVFGGAGELLGEARAQTGLQRQILAALLTTPASTGVGDIGP